MKIKIGHQRQANKPIYLHQNGYIVCGNFVYKGRYKKKFEEYYKVIVDLANTKPKNDILDVSKVIIWDATIIYDHYMVPKWQKTLSVTKLEKLANETEIRKILDDIRPEFVRALGRKWKRIFKKSYPKPGTPQMAWQIL